MDTADWDERYRSADRLWAAGPNLFVEDRLKTLVPGRGLDLAAGDGRNSIWLAEQGWKMVAVDFSEVAVARGRELSDDVEFVVADVLTWATDETFDLIVIAYLHLPADDFESVVRTAVGRLAEGGELFMIGHDLSNLVAGWGGPQYPEILWEVDNIVSWIDGLSMRESGVVRRPADTEEGRQYARDALIRARRSV